MSLRPYRYLISFMKRHRGMHGQAESDWRPQNMLTELDPCAWLVWARERNWARETHSFADIVLVSATPIDALPDTIRRLEDLLA